MVYRYIGGGAYLLGVPARDLDEAEWDALGPELQAVAVERGLYEADGRPQTADGGQAKRGKAAVAKEG